MKKIIFFFLLLSVAVFLLCSCGQKAAHEDGRISVVCTAFPQYNWAKNIIKDSDNVNLVLLNTKGTDMHSFEPSAKDIITISKSDILIAIGGESDKWALDAVTDKDNTTVINLLEITGEYSNFTDHEHTDSCEDNHHHSESSADEHIWMSLKKSAVFAEIITKALCEKDTENQELYQSNYDNYVNLILDLDASFEKAVSESDKNIMVVADRFPFKHLAEDYGIQCLAAFPGCSSDTDASPDTIIKLSKAIDEYNLSFVAVTENTSGKTAKAVIGNTSEKNQKTVVVDSMQSVSVKDIENGVTYLGIMERNLEAIKTLLEIK